MPPLVFKEFEMVYISFDTFLLSLSLSIGKRSTLAKNKERGVTANPSLLVSTGLGYISKYVQKTVVPVVMRL